MADQDLAARIQKLSQELKDLDKRDGRVDARASVRGSLATNNVVYGIMALILIGFSVGFIIVGEEDTASPCSIWLVGYGIANIVAAALILAVLVCCNVLITKELDEDKVKTQYDATSTTYVLQWSLRAPITLWNAAALVFFIGFLVNLSSCAGAQHDWAFFGAIFAPALVVVLCIAACAGVAFGFAVEEKSRKKEEELASTIGNSSYYAFA